VSASNPEPTRLYLLRHATSEWSRAGRDSGSSDIGLAAEADAELNITAARLTGIAFTRVAVSPLRRCQQTWAKLARRVQFDNVQTEPRLREIDYGDWEGRTRAQIAAATPQALACWDRDPAAAAPPGGEAISTVAARIDALLAELAQTRNERILLVTHRTVLRVLLARLLALPLSEYRRRLDHAPAAVSVVELHAPDRGRLLRYNVAPDPLLP